MISFLVEKTMIQIQKTVEYLVRQNEELFLLIAIRQRNIDFEVEIIKIIK